MNFISQVIVVNRADQFLFFGRMAYVSIILDALRIKVHRVQLIVVFTVK